MQLCCFPKHANLPKADREAMRKPLDETSRLIDTTLNMVIVRLGEILRHTPDDDFLREAARLDNYDEWMQAERGVPVADAEQTHAVGLG
jgi:hypothetical protein